MNSIQTRYHSVLRALIWLVVIVAVTALALSIVVVSITTSHETSRAAIENYHMRSLNIVREANQELAQLRTQLGTRAAVAAAEFNSFSGSIYVLQNNVTDLEFLQQAIGTPLLEGAIARLRTKFDRFKRAFENVEVGQLPEPVASFQLAVTQLEKLHMTAVDELADTMASDRDTQSAQLLLAMVMIIMASAVTYFYAHRSLRSSLSEHLKTQDALDLSEQRLRQGEKMHALGQLVGGIAHDFNNLLMIINGYAETMLHEKELSKNVRTSLVEISKAGDRAAELTKQLLMFAREQPIVKIRVDLNDLVRNTESMLSTLIGDDVQISINLDAVDMTVEADPGQLQQVLTNLIINARDATTANGTISISTKGIEVTASDSLLDIEAGSYCVLSVTDDGRGMNPEVLSRAFDPFFTTKEVGQGTGLGLATVHGVVKSHDGHIVTNSHVGVGTTFEIYLPRYAQAEFQTVEIASTNVAGGNETVLLIEDEPQIRALTEESLTALGYRVNVAESGTQAIELSRQKADSIHAIVSDVIMPGMSGPEAVEEITHLHPNAIVIYVSGYTDDIVFETGISNNKAIILRKPFRLEELAVILREGLDGRYSGVA